MKNFIQFLTVAVGSVVGTCIYYESVPRQPFNLPESVPMSWDAPKSNILEEAELALFLPGSDPDMIPPIRSQRGFDPYSQKVSVSPDAVNKYDLRMRWKSKNGLWSKWSAPCQKIGF